MHRRDVVKGLVAFSLAAGKAGSASLCTKATTPVPGAFRVILDGPFSVVLKTVSPTADDISSVVVFTPKEKNDKHQFKLNGIPLTLKQNHFSLDFSGFTTPTQPLISSDFSGFCADHTPLADDDTKHFVTISLPCPNRIVADANVAPIPVIVGGNQVNLPQTHILEYDLAPTATVTMTYNELALPASPINNMFIFEVGMVPGSDSDCSHALDFYNNSILPFFPALQNNKITKVVTCPAFTGHKYMSRVKVTGVEKPIPIQAYTSTLECKSGGLIGTTP